MSFEYSINFLRLSIFCQFQTHGMSEDQPLYMLEMQIKDMKFQHPHFLQVLQKAFRNHQISIVPIVWTSGPTPRVNQHLRTCSRVCVRAPRERVEHHTMGSISYCNSYQSTTTMTLFKALPSKEYKMHHAGLAYMTHLHQAQN